MEAELKVMTEIHIVEVCGGEYEDYYHRPIKAFFDKPKAEEFRDKLIADQQAFDACIERVQDWTEEWREANSENEPAFPDPADPNVPWSEPSDEAYAAYNAAYATFEQQRRDAVHAKAVAAGMTFDKDHEIFDGYRYHDSCGYYITTVPL